jgi:hypothetical protein
MVKLLLINPCNPVVSMSKIQRWNRLNKFRVWKPLGLLILARLTPPSWEVEVLDENLGLITNLTCRYNHLLDRKVDALRSAPPETASPKHGLRPQED